MNGLIVLLLRNIFNRLQWSFTSFTTAAYYVQSKLPFSGLSGVEVSVHGCLCHSRSSCNPNCRRRYFWDIWSRLCLDSMVRVVFPLRESHLVLRSIKRDILDSSSPASNPRESCNDGKLRSCRLKLFPEVVSYKHFLEVFLVSAMSWHQRVAIVASFWYMSSY